MRSHGRARVSSRNPNAFGICDRCGFLFNHNRLQWQFDWAGAGLINKRILVCSECLDVPQEQLRAIVVTADPVPIQNPRTQDYPTAETNYRYTQGNTVNQRTGIPVPGGDKRITQNDKSRVTQQTGEPPGGLNQLPGTDWNAPVVIYQDREIGLPYGNTSVPFTGPLSPPFNIQTQWNNQWYFGMLTGYYWQNDSLSYNTWVTSGDAPPTPPATNLPVILVANALPPGINAYEWDNVAGFGSKYADPAVPFVTGIYAYSYGVSFSRTNVAVAATTYYDDFIGAYAWTDENGFGAKYDNPSPLPGESGSRIVFSHDNSAVMWGMSDNPCVAAYQWDDEAGFGTAYSNPSPSLNRYVYSVDIAPSDAAIVVSQNYYPKPIIAYAWDNVTGFGTKYTSPVFSTYAFMAMFSPSGKAVALVGGSDSFVDVWAWDDVTGFGTKYTNPSTYWDYDTGNSVRFSSDGSVIGLTGTGTDHVYFYPWSDDFGFGTQYAAPVPAVSPGNYWGAWDSIFTREDAAVVLATDEYPYVSAYTWDSATGFGTKYADPATPLSGDGGGLGTK